MAGGLPCPPFFRCHRAHVINLAKVEELQRHGGYRVLLKHGLVLAVARARWSLLLVLMDLL
jgi:DNA-binding LytR/AlgR family response regulator